MKKGRQTSAKASSPLATFPVAETFKKVSDEYLREIASGAVVAERRVREVFGELAAANLKAIIPEQRLAIARDAFQRLIDGDAIDDVVLWLSIKVRDQRRSLEKSAKTVSGIVAERKRGGSNSAAARRARWAPWRKWICEEKRVTNPDAVHPNFKRSIIEVIRFRSGARIPKPPRDASIPDELPIIRGLRGKPPSEDSIRRNLFGSRAK
jgi:hypothetical protein